MRNEEIVESDNLKAPASIDTGAFLYLSDLYCLLKFLEWVKNDIT